MNMPLPIYEPKKNQHPLSQIKYILAIAAGKGGVGKSTVTINLALALKEQGYRVGILDADIYGPSLRKMLPEDRLPTQKDQLIQPALCAGIKVISMAYFRREHESASVRAPIANGVITQFIKQVDWGELDFLLIDFPPGTGDVQLTLSQQANLTGALMVTTPQEVAILDVRKAMHLFEQVKVPIVGVVENMSYYQDPSLKERVYLFGRGGGQRLATESGVPFLGEVPVDPLICECTDQGVSLFKKDASRSRLATQAFDQLAKEVAAHVHQMKTEANSCLSQFELIWKEM